MESLPTPMFILTEKPFPNSCSLEFKEKNSRQTLILSYDETRILFKVIEYSLPQKEFEYLSTLEELADVNKYFKNFDNINELINSLKNAYNEKQLSISINDNKCYLNILNPIKNQNFDLILNYKEIDIKTQIQNLIKIIEKDNKRIAALEENKKEYIKRIEILEEKVNSYEESQKVDKKLIEKNRKTIEELEKNSREEKIRIKELENFINKIKEEKEAKKKEFFYKSDILNNIEKKNVNRLVTK